MTEAGPGQAGSGPGAQSVGMRLNHLAPEPGGGGSPFFGPPGGTGGDLASSAPEKKAAAKAIEEHLEPDTKKAGGWADGETGDVVTAFGPKDGSGWLTSGAVKKALSTWGDQVRNQLNRLAGDKSALRGTNTALQGTDLGIGTKTRAGSPLDLY